MSIRGKEKEQQPKAKILYDTNMVRVSISAMCLVPLVANHLLGSCSILSWRVFEIIFPHLAGPRALGPSEAHFVLCLNTQCVFSRTRELMNYKWLKVTKTMKTDSLGHLTPNPGLILF